MCSDVKLKAVQVVPYGHAVQLLLQLLCWGLYTHEDGLSIHLSTILYTHLPSSLLSLYHLTHLQLFVSPFHPWSLSQPHLSALLHLFLLPFHIFLIFPLLCSLAHVKFVMMWIAQGRHQVVSVSNCVSSPQTSHCANSGLSIKLSTQLFYYLYFRLTCWNTEVHQVLQINNKLPVFVSQNYPHECFVHGHTWRL